MRYKIVGRFIEIYFDNIPDNKIRDTLKVCGWRWLSKNKCWSNINTKDNLDWVKALEKEFNPKEEDSLLKLKKETIGMTNLLVRSNSFYCNQHHELEDMAGEVEVVDKFNNIRVYLIPIVFCKKCNVYYVLEETYKSLRMQGRIRAEILSYKSYKNRGNSKWDELNDVSPLKAWGYTVSEDEGYTDVQRQSILEDIIDYKILTKDKVLSYLDFFIKLNQHKDNSVLNKWEVDRKYIAQYNIGTSKKVKVDKIIVMKNIYR